MNTEGQAVRKIEASPICEEDGQLIVYFTENGKSIGMVEVYDGCTGSGWDESPTADITEEIQIHCEQYAVSQFEAMMLERVSQTILAQMPPGSTVDVLPVRVPQAEV